LDESSCGRSLRMSVSWSVGWLVGRLVVRSLVGCWLVGWSSEGPHSKDLAHSLKTKFGRPEKIYRMWHGNSVCRFIFQRNGLPNFDSPKIGAHTQMIATRYKLYTQHQRKKIGKKK
jgi:hypothetical protein